MQRGILEITTTNWVSGHFLPYRLEGVDALSISFSFEVWFYIKGSQIKADDLVGERMTITIHNHAEEEPVYYSGLVSHADRHPEDNYGRRPCWVKVVPWMEALHLGSDCRHYQDLSVVEIFQKLWRECCEEPYELELIRAYPKIPYVVQYNETHAEFLDRILQQMGIFYYFNHDAQRSTIVLCDHSKNLPNVTTLPYRFSQAIRNPIHSSFVHMYSWEHVRSIKPNIVAGRAYDYQQAGQTLTGSLRRLNFSHPFGFKSDSFIDFQHQIHAHNRQQFDDELKLRIKRHECQADTFEACTNCRTIRAGQHFQLTGHQSTENGSYFVTKVEHYVEDYSQIPGYAEFGINQLQGYWNRLYGTPSQYGFVPEQTQKIPEVFGVDIAKVVGPPGKDIYTDRYGRIKIQFTWDREGKKNEKSSGWVRVMQMYAGKNWGAQFIPRIGDEVMVGFIDGDITKPVVIGSQYNRDNPNIYKQPDHANISGIKTNIPGTNQGHEVRFDDTPGDELFAIKSAGTTTIDAKGKINKKVGGSEEIHVKGQTKIIAEQGDAHITAKKAEFRVGGSALILNEAGILIEEGGA